VVVAVSDEKARGGLGESGEHGEFVGALAEATDKRVITPGQQTRTCTESPMLYYSARLRQRTSGVADKHPSPG
jgi:hypothetical protein